MSAIRWSAVLTLSVSMVLGGCVSTGGSGGLGGGDFADAPARLAPLAAGRFVLSAPLTFVDATDREWRAPVGTLTDGASIPEPFLPLIGARLDRRWRDAAIIHDAYCARANHYLPGWRSLPWEAVHRMFYDALLAGGTPPLRALVMYAAVYLGGPRWDDPARALDEVDASLLRRELVRCIRWIERERPDAEAVEIWMREREPSLLAAASSVR